MNKKPLIVSVPLAALALLTIVFLWGPSSVPAGQEALITLTDGNFNEFERTFDSKTDQPRLVLLLSPT